MKNLLKFQHQHIPEYVIGLEENIRLAVLKDELDLWVKRDNNNFFDLNSVSYLKNRIEELENYRT
mgnify:CR=1 FL=1